MKQRKRDFKTVQVGFKTKGVYDKFHRRARSSCGDTKNADCRYIRECIEQNTRTKKSSVRDRVITLVESTQQLNDLYAETENICHRDLIANTLEKQVKLWVL